MSLKDVWLFRFGYFHLKKLRHYEFFCNFLFSLKMVFLRVVTLINPTCRSLIFTSVSDPIMWMGSLPTPLLGPLGLCLFRALGTLPAGVFAGLVQGLPHEEGWWVVRYMNLQSYRRMSNCFPHWPCCLVTLGLIEAKRDHSRPCVSAGFTSLDTEGRLHRNADDSMGTQAQL